ncbi:MAG: PEP-CTERM sorting domain-containing protein [Cyanobacteriota bacterium]|nr:PEP-CTERM sorting domain-containing protein [Cyanobacteriota bacterium]
MDLSHNNFLTQCSFYAAAIGLSLGLVSPTFAADRITLQIKERQLVVTIDQLTNYANTGNLSAVPEIEEIYPFLTPDKQEAVDKFPAQLKDSINIRPNEPLSPDEQDFLNFLVPSGNPQEQQQALELIAEKGNDRTVLDFLKALPVETLTTDNFLPVLTAYVPDTKPPKQQPDSKEKSAINVLWYGQNLTYNQSISNLASAASSYDPWGDGSLDWNLTFWNPGEPAPDFSQYDTLVIGSAFPELYGFDASRLLSSKETIEEARGSRTFISGQDADLHYILTHGSVPNGPFGFLINAVNWAGSGTDLGIVSLPDGRLSQGRIQGTLWWLHEDSFLKNELEGDISYFTENWIELPTATSGFPVNEGLTSAGLSNWAQSSHVGLSKNIPGYLSINNSGNYFDWSVTMVTASEAGGATKGSQEVPEPASVLGLLAFGSLGTFSLLKRK